MPRPRVAAKPAHAPEARWKTLWTGVMVSTSHSGPRRHQPHDARRGEQQGQDKVPARHQRSTDPARSSPPNGRTCRARRRRAASNSSRGTTARSGVEYGSQRQCRPEEELCQVIGSAPTSPPIMLALCASMSAGLHRAPRQDQSGSQEQSVRVAARSGRSCSQWTREARDSRPNPCAGRKGRASSIEQTLLCDQHEGPLSDLPVRRRMFRRAILRTCPPR